MMAVHQHTFIAKGPPPVPADFDETFVRIGRLACQPHYKVARLVIDAWLRQRGKQRLIDARAKFVSDRIASEREKRLSVREMKKVLDHAFPANGDAQVELARSAAAFLRLSRNGGWPVSQSPCGRWWVGTSLKTADEMIAFARRKGFASDLTGDA